MLTRGDFFHAPFFSFSDLAQNIENLFQTFKQFIFGNLIGICGVPISQHCRVTSFGITTSKRAQCEQILGRQEKVHYLLCTVPKSHAAVEHTLRLRAPQNPTKRVTNSCTHPYQPIGVFPKYSRTFLKFSEFSKFRESEKSLKHELGSI